MANKTEQLGTKGAESRTVATRITNSMYERIVNMLTANAHLNMADYIRDLIRKDLERKTEAATTGGQAIDHSE